MKKQKSKKFIELCKKYGVDPDVIPEILTYEEACKVAKLDPKKDRDPMQRSIVIAEAFRKEAKFKVNYRDKTQRRHFPVFEMTPSGLVFSHAFYENWNSSSHANVGAPFVLPSHDHAKFVGKHFLPQYAKWMVSYKVK